MSDCRQPQLSSYTERQRCSPPRGPETLAQSVRSMRLLCFIMALVALTAAGDLSVLAQEEAARPLERVDVEAPQRRITSTRAATDQGAGYDEPSPWDREPSESRDAWGRTGPGPAIMPSMSVVTDKSSVSSVGSAALPADVNVVTRQEIDRLDVRTYTDLFRQVPGLRSFAYGAGEIGHPFAMRGFNGAHGSDVAVYVDGVPQNLPSSVVAMNGASDVSWLAPEMIERIEVIKGPFSALYGNQAQAGVVNFITKNSEPSPNLTVSTASFGTFRTVPIITAEAWSPTPFLVYEYQTTEGYRDNGQYRRLSLFNKVTVPLWDGNLSLRFNYYRSDFGVPGVLRINDVKSGKIKRTACVNPSDGGDQRTWSFVLNYSPVGRDSGLYADAYVEHTFRERFQVWVPYPQTWSIDNRVFYGGRIFYNFVFGNVASLMAGAETRYDSANVQEWNTVDREITNPINNYDLGLLNATLFAQAQVKFADTVKIVGGVRKDYIVDKVNNLLTPANSGTGYPHTFNPKVGFVITPWKNINIFGNKGVGFRAPGATDLSPPYDRTAFDIAVAKTESWDLGFNGTFFDQFYVALDWYQTDMEKELRSINGQAVNIGDSQRNGWEAEVRYYATAQFNVFANYAWVEAKLKNPTTPGQTLVQGIPQDVIKAGIGLTYDLAPDVKFLGDLYCEYVGEQPYYIGDSLTPVYGPDYVMYNMKFAWQGRNWGIFAAAKYQPKEYSSDSESWPVEDGLTFNPQPLWDFNGGLKYTF